MNNRDHPEQVRVTSRIGRTIVSFCDGADTFHADTLRRYVTNRCGMVAPESTGRCLRSLRQKGVLNYEVVSHSDSLYKMIPIDHTDDNQIELDFR